MWTRHDPPDLVLDYAVILVIHCKLLLIRVRLLESLLAGVEFDFVQGGFGG